MADTTPVRIGRYDIIKVLGRGGMGEVLLGQDAALGRRVAIKRPFRSAQEDGLARFQVEARAATLKHPNIPEVYEMGEFEGLPYIAMEFLEGEALDKIISANRPLNLIHKLSIIEQVCLALGYAHKNNIIHRDIKPANVIVQADGVAKIIDFGIAKIQDSSSPGLTQTSQVIGSLHYIAPERFKGGPIDGRVDLFSAGVTLYKLLTGVEPFTGGEATASYKIVNESHTLLSAYLHDYPPALDDIVAKSLAKNPEERYQTGEDFADDLHEVIDELKRGRVKELIGDADRLATENRLAPAMDLLEEAYKLDPSNTTVRRLRRSVREQQDKQRKSDRLRECTTRADEAMLVGNYDEALVQLREAQNIDTTSADIRQRIEAAEERKRRAEMSARALAEAEAAQGRGDLTAALRVVQRALQDDPEHSKLVALNNTLSRQVEAEAQRGRVLELLDAARRELVQRNLSEADRLLTEAEQLDATNIETAGVRRDYQRAIEQEQRRELLEEIQSRINGFLQSEDYEQAQKLLTLAIEKLPNETLLHRLKAEVDSEAAKFATRKLADSAIAEARDLFASSPLEALTVLQKALDKMPGNERLIAYEHTLREQLNTQRAEQVRTDALKKARDLMADKKYPQAIDVLEAYQVEFGAHDDIRELLEFAKREQAEAERASLVERCAAEGRTLMRDGRLDEAQRTLEKGLQDSGGDQTLTRLLGEVRNQQEAMTRKIEALEKRVASLRERGERDEAIRLLQEQIAATPGIVSLKESLTQLQAENDQHKASSKAIAAAREAAAQKNYSAGLEALQAVLAAYGESPELAEAQKEIETARAQHADEVVGQAIETARAALLKGDSQGALTALKTCTEWLSFADGRKQGDWQRIGQSVKKALEQSGSQETGAAFDEQLNEIARTRPKRFPLWAVALGGLVLVGIIVVLVLKIQSGTPTAAHIKITKAPGGSSVSIDNAPGELTNDAGELLVKVKPGTHTVQVSKDGYDAFNDKLDVSAGETVQDVVSLVKQLPAGTAGTLTLFGNLPEFKVIVDGNNMGLHHNGESIHLAQGAHKIRYTNSDESDAQDHQLQIVANQSIQDHFTLKTPQPKQQQQQQPQPQATKPATPQPVAPTPQPQAAPQPSGSIAASANSIERGQSVTLNWQVANAGAVSVNEFGGVAPQGSRTVQPQRTTTFMLYANGSQLLSEVTVEVHEPRPQAAAPAPVAAAPRAPAMPDRGQLEAALGAYKGVFQRASGKNKKDCQTAFASAFGGKLNGWARWCDMAKSFDIAEQCSAVGGSPDAPTLGCSETLTVRLKDGDPQQTHAQRVFHFSKGGDGWQITGW